MDVNDTPVQSPLTLFVPIRHEKVYELRRDLQKLQNLLRDGLTEIGVVHFARIVFVPNSAVLALITAYDGSFEDYIQAFVRNPQIAQTFDSVLPAVDDFLTPPSVPPAESLIPVAQHADAFVQFLRHFDYTSSERRESFAWYSAYPDLTVKKILATAQAPEKK